MADGASIFSLLYQGQQCAVFNFVDMLREMQESNTSKVSANYHSGMIDSSAQSSHVQTWFEAQFPAEFQGSIVDKLGKSRKKIEDAFTQAADAQTREYSGEQDKKIGLYGESPAQELLSVIRMKMMADVSAQLSGVGAGVTTGTVLSGSDEVPENWAGIYEENYHPEGYLEMVSKYRGKIAAVQPYVQALGMQQSMQFGMGGADEEYNPDAPTNLRLESAYKQFQPYNGMDEESGEEDGGAEGLERFGRQVAKGIRMKRMMPRIAGRYGSLNNGSIAKHMAGSFVARQRQVQKNVYALTHAILKKAPSKNSIYGFDPADGILGTARGGIQTAATAFAHMNMRPVKQKKKVPGGVSWTSAQSIPVPFFDSGRFV